MSRKKLNIFIREQRRENKLDSENFILRPEDGETVEDLAVSVIMASYGDGRVVGMGGLRAFETEITREMAVRMWNGEDISHDYPVNVSYRPRDIYMDYVFGRCCKTGLREVDGTLEVRISSRDLRKTGV